MNKVIVLILSVLFFASCSQTNSDANLHITGNIKGFKKGKIYIQKVEDTTLVVLDTIILNGNSTFESHLKIDSPEMYYLFIDRGVSNSVDNNLLFFAEPGKINIDTDLEFFLGKAKITGSKNHEVYEQYKDIISQFNDQQLNYIKDELLAYKGKKTISKEDNQKKQDDLLRRRYLYAGNFALNNAKYEVAPYIALTDIYDINLKYLDTIGKSMSPKVAKSKYGKKLTEYLAQRKKEE